MQESDVFLMARRLKPPERDRYLAEACGVDALLRADIEDLLAADGDGSSTSESKHELRETQTLPGGSIFAKRYRLVERIGEGGMGVVFVADQLEPVQRRVAVKIIRSRFASTSVLARFELEGRALALMDHPNIAKVFDAGVDQPDGSPYLVMEWIQGVPITKYCEEAKLSPRQRVELFIPVCHAIQHAHQKGIIHRDLKPTNIIVGVYDGKPVPKVIDFGVAKPTADSLTQRGVATEMGSLIGTLEYMSPEQAELNNLDIDTRTDIYALGVILYELLTGMVPFSRKELEHADLVEMLRVIKEVEPPRPSTRLSTATRHGVPSTVSRKQLTHLQGDLDCIVMKALEKERQRRYETADALAVDLQHYLADEPIEARPTTTRYRLQKFIRKHRGAVLAASLVALALLGGIVATSWALFLANEQRDLAERNSRKASDAVDEERVAKEKAQDAEKKGARQLAVAREERQITKDVLDFFLNDVIRQADSSKQLSRHHKPNPNLTVKEALQRATAAIDGKFRQEGDRRFQTEVAVRLALAETLTAVGEYAPALEQYEKILARRLKGYGPDHRSTRLSRALVLTAAVRTGDYGRVIEIVESAGDLESILLKRDGPLTTGELNSLATAYTNSGKPEKALLIYAFICEESARKLGEWHQNTLAMLHNRGLTFLKLKRPAEAMPLLEKVFKSNLERLGPDHPTTLLTEATLAMGYTGLGNHDEALRILEEVLKKQSNILGPDHPNTLRTCSQMGHTYWMKQRYDLALSLYERAYDGRMRKLGKEHPETIKAISDLGAAYFLVGEDELAAEVLANLPARKK